MAKTNCDACNQIKAIDPNLAINGWSDTECTSFKNDTGLNPSSGHNDCTDIELLNDCLIGNMEQEIDAYNNCDWKKFAKKFIPNLWTVISAIKCAICGLWTNIHNLWSRINRYDCLIESLMDEKVFNIDGMTEAELGLGVEWRTSGGGVIAYPSIVGNAFVLRVNGSLHFSGSKWKNFTGNTDDGNWLVYRYKLNKQKYGLKTIWNNTIHTNNAGDISGYIQCYGEGARTPGYWGDADPNGSVVVPQGYIYLEVRVANIRSWGITGDDGNVTLTGVVPILSDYSSKC